LCGYLGSHVEAEQLSTYEAQLRQLGIEEQRLASTDLAQRGRYPKTQREPR